VNLFIRSYAKKCDRMAHATPWNLSRYDHKKHFANPNTGNVATVELGLSKWV